MVWMWIKSISLSRPGAIIAAGVATSVVAYGVYKLYGYLLVEDDEYFERLVNNNAENLAKKRILVVGLDGSGKTCFVRCLGKGNKEDPIPRPTVGFNVKSISLGAFAFDIWDLGGSDLCRSYWKEFSPNIDVIVWAVDSANCARLSESSEALHNFLQNDVSPGIPILIIATKQDLERSLSPDKVMQSLELSNKLKQEHHFEVLGVHVSVGGQRKGIWRAYQRLTALKPCKQSSK